MNLYTKAFPKSLHWDIIHFKFSSVEGVCVCVCKTGVINLLGHVLDQAMTDGYVWGWAAKDIFFCLLAADGVYEKQTLPLRKCLLRWSSPLYPCIFHWLSSFYIPSLMLSGIILTN